MNLYITEEPSFDLAVSNGINTLTESAELRLSADPRN